MQVLQPSAPATPIRGPPWNQPSASPRQPPSASQLAHNSGDAPAEDLLYPRTQVTFAIPTARGASRPRAMRERTTMMNGSTNSKAESWTASVQPPQPKHRAAPTLTASGSCGSNSPAAAPAAMSSSSSSTIKSSTRTVRPSSSPATAAPAAHRRPPPRPGSARISGAATPPQHRPAPPPQHRPAPGMSSAPRGGATQADNHIEEAWRAQLQKFHELASCPSYTEPWQPPAPQISDERRRELLMHHLRMLSAVRTSARLSERSALSPLLRESKPVHAGRESIDAAVNIQLHTRPSHLSNTSRTSQGKAADRDHLVRADGAPNAVSMVPSSHPPRQTRFTVTHRPPPRAPEIVNSVKAESLPSGAGSIQQAMEDGFDAAAFVSPLPGASSSGTRRNTMTKRVSSTEQAAGGKKYNAWLKKSSSVRKALGNVMADSLALTGSKRIDVTLPSIRSLVASEWRAMSRRSP